jgi:hypothetical protein
VSRTTGPSSPGASSTLRKPCANEAMAEFFELDGRPEDAREARKAAKAEWREAAKHDREALKLIESELVERELIERAGGAA